MLRPLARPWFAYRSWCARSASVRFFVGEGSKDLDLPRRGVNPEPVDGSHFVEAICFNLHHHFPERYQCFSSLALKTLPARKSLETEDSKTGKLLQTDNAHQEELLSLLETFGENQIEEKCLERFQNWADKAKLNIAYTLYANNLKCDKFMNQVVRHLGPRVERLKREELVAMLLVLYLQKSMNTEDIFEVLDPTQLQMRLSALLDAGLLSNAEICAACLGLKKIDRFVAKEDELRSAIYSKLRFISKKIYESDLPASPVDNMAILHLSLLLHQGSMLLYDEIETVDKLLKSFLSISHLLDTRTAVKMMTFGMNRNFHEPNLTLAVLTRLREAGEISYLSLRDISTLLKFLTIVDLEKMLLPDEKEELLNLIADELDKIIDADCSLVDAGSLLQSWGYLGQYLKFNRNKFEEIFKDLNTIPEETIAKMNQNELTLACCHALYKAFFPQSYHQKGDLTLASKSLSENIVRSIGSLSCTLAIYEPEFHSQSGLRKDISSALLKFNQSLVPLEAASPQMTLEKLSRRRRLLIQVYREMVRALDGECYVKLIHVLPHFQEPDLVFGHFAGNKLTVPDSLTQASSTDLKRAPEIGEWFVVTSDTRRVEGNTNYKKEVHENFSEEKIEAGPIQEPLRNRQLRSLGFNVVQINFDKRKDQNGIRFWVDKMVSSILTGCDQIPSGRRTPHI